MNIKFKSIHIQNFYSIQDAFVEFKEGITKVIGINLDNITEDINNIEECSNGSGKSTIFYAVSQCLFNKSIKNNSIKIDSTYNIYTDLPYTLTLELSVNGVDYTIKNCRIEGQISITQDGVDITPKGLKNQIQLIETILGLDFNTFNILTYVNQKTIDNILNITNDKNVLYKFFNIGVLQYIEKNITVDLRNTKRDLKEIQSNIKTLEYKIDLPTSYNPDKLVELQKQKRVLEYELENVSKLDIVDEIKRLTINLNELQDTKADLKLAQTKQDTLIQTKVKSIKTLDGGVCPTCGSIINDSQLEELNNELKELKQQLDIITDKLKSNESNIKKVEEYIQSKKNNLKLTINTLKTEISKVDKQIITLEETHRLHKETMKSLKVLNKKLDNLKIEEEDKKHYIEFLNSTLDLIKSGVILKQYITDFTKAFNFKLLELSKLIDVDFKIVCVEQKGGVVFKIIKDGNQVNYHLLSSGEQTRVSLVVLIATILTLESVTNININLLMFDELLSVLDSSGLTTFSTLLNTLKKDKCLMIVQHHDELPDTIFNNKLTIIKENNLSKVKDE